MARSSFQAGVTGSRASPGRSLDPRLKPRACGSGLVNVSHRAYCGYAKWYGTIIVQHGLKVNGKPVVWPDSGAVYRGPTTGGWFSGYGTRARNTAGTQQ